MKQIGVSEAELSAYERVAEAKRLPAGKDYWHRQVFQSRATEDLDAMAECGVRQFAEFVDPRWLQSEAQKPFGLGVEFLNNPLHLMGGVRVGTGAVSPGPQRFARMLLLTLGHLAKNDDLDFFNAALFVPEVAILGNSISEIKQLGPEARRKLSSLPALSDDLVTSTIFELLVGAACLRRGLEVEMVPEDRSKAVPDFRITGLGAIPGAVECKRRLGFTAYEMEEARLVETLYSAIRPDLQARGIHSSIEVSFSIPIREVDVKTFSDDVLSAVNWDRDSSATATWGSVQVCRLPFFRMVERTRLYSPHFLEKVFGWEVMQSDWDGILCEVEPPQSILVESFRMPRCMKWRSDSEEAFNKKSRGVTSMWGSAIKQIPPGEIGFVYIAYPEGNRPALADARTQNIMKAMEEAWHRWFVRIPVSVIGRLYPRPIGHGNPDLIESSLPGAGKGQEHWLTYLPWLIFTRQFEDQPAV